MNLRRLSAPHLHDSVEALAILGDIAYRVARRRADDPATLDHLVATLSQARDRLARTSHWLAENDPDLRRLFDACVGRVEEAVTPRLAAAWANEDRSPSDAVLARETVSMIAAWRAQVRVESRSRVMGRLARPRLARALAGG